MSHRGLQIAIDGPAGAGKSTVARQLAAKLGYVYIDTGAMYRAIAVKVLEAGVDPHDEQAVVDLTERTTLSFEPDEDGEGAPPRVLLDGRDVTDRIRDPDVTSMVSKIAGHPRLRERLVLIQRELARNGRVVMDGRDIGTVVLPDADVKVFLTASLEERARRRHREMNARGHAVPLSRLEQEIAQRDREDLEREASPLQKAEDAVLIDTTGKDAASIVDAIYRLWQTRARAEGVNP